jgi:hypothetical protein
MPLQCIILHNSDSRVYATAEAVMAGLVPAIHVVQ